MIDTEKFTRERMDNVGAFTESDYDFVIMTVEIMRNTIFKEVTDIEIETGIRAAIAMYLTMRTFGDVND